MRRSSPRAFRRPFARVGALALTLVAAVATARGGEDAPDRPQVPVANASFVFDGDARMAEAFARAETAGEDANAWVEAVRGLQGVVEATAPGEDEGAVAPYVVAIRGAECYEGAGRAAHHAILAGGERALEAYATSFASVANALLERGAAQRDRALLAEVVRRFLPLEAGRRAALLLADVALDRGDTEEALGWLARLEDVEETSAEPPERIAPWRAARIARVASALAATPSEVPAVRAALAEAARAGPAEAVRATTRLRLRLPRAAPSKDWTTSGGGPSRTEVAASTGSALRPVWWEALSPPGDGEEDGMRAFRETRDRPSPAVLPRALVLDDHVFVSDGVLLRGWRRPTAPGGPSRRLVVPLRRDTEMLATDPGLDARETHGLVEGHSLSAVRRAEGRWTLYAAVKDPRLESSFDGDVDPEPIPFEAQDDHLRAFWFDGVRLDRRWRVGGREGGGGSDDRSADPRLDGVRLYGAPLLYRGRLWVAGLRPTKNADRLEAWIHALDPVTGRMQFRTSLGFANPVRTNRPDEAIPSSPAAAEGRVVVVTGLGIAAAVDATDGRPVWVVRYDRDIVTSGRIGRLRQPSGESPRQSLFANEPPIAALGRAWLAPTDSSRLLCVHDRPRGPRRELLAWRRWRLGDQFAGMAAEQLVGLRVEGDAGATLVVAGKPAATEADPPGPTVVGLDALDDGALRWQAASPTGAAAPYGRALLTTAEVIVPTEEGIAIFDATPPNAGRHLATLDAGALPATKEGAEDREDEPAPRLWGALVPWPGVGVLTVNEAWIAVWAR